MTINKNTDLEFSLQQGTEKGGVYTNFYTEDKGSASIRIRLSSNEYYLDLTKTDLKPVLFLFHEDGSIFEIKDFINVMPDKGLIQYNLSDNVIAHAGKVKAKLFLKNTEQSVHVANFTFDIKDSGIEGAVGKEIRVDILEDMVKGTLLENIDLFRADPKEIAEYLEPYAENVAKQEFEKLSSAKQVDSEVIQSRNGKVSLNERLNDSDVKLNNTQRVINVRAMGAKGDGVTDDYQAIQNAITQAEKSNSNVYIPSGTYFVSQTLRTAHKTTPHYTTGIRIFGDGKTTELKGSGANAVDYSDLTKTSKGALIALHGGNNIVENLELTQCTVGIFMGQHPDVTNAYSSVSFNIIENIWMERVGTGILMIHSLGNNYNKFKKIHILNCQIGVHLGLGIYMTDKYNNNRNVFDSVRVSGAWIGYLIEQADGNAFNSLYGENMTPVSDFVGSKPVQIPDSLNGKHVAFLVLDGQYNFFDKAGVENCEWHLYSVGFRTTFDNMMVRDDAKSRSLVSFPDPTRLPQYYHSDSVITPFYIYQPDANQYFRDSNGMGIKSRLFDIDYHWQQINLEDYSTDILNKASASRSKMRRLGGLITWQANYRFTKSTDSDKNSPIKIKIPFNDKLKALDVLYSNEVSAGVTFTFPVYVGVSGNLELRKGRFSTKGETTALGASHIIIEAPANGWHETAQYNNIVFDLNFYNE